MNTDLVKHKAKEIVTLLTPFCERITIAGSVRRDHINQESDIEILCIPKEVIISEDIFSISPDTKFVNEFAETIKVLAIYNKIKKGNPYFGKYICIDTHINRAVNKIQIDIFTCNKENWGYILAIRTGSAKFSKSLADRWVSKGFVGYEGNLYKKEGLKRNKINIYEEIDLFNLLNLLYIEPNRRY